jgi:hypothetical protein
MGRARHDPPGPSLQSGLVPLSVGRKRASPAVVTAKAKARDHWPTPGRHERNVAEGIVRSDGAQIVKAVAGEMRALRAK